MIVHVSSIYCTKNLQCKSLLNIIIREEVVEQIIVAKPVNKNKFMQIREKQRTASAKLSFKLTLGTSKCSQCSECELQHHQDLQIYVGSQQQNVRKCHCEFC